MVKRKRRKIFLILVISIVILLLLSVVLWRTEKASNKVHVSLTVQETAGIDRVDEPLTSGVPLPIGRVKNCTDLLLINESTGDAVPCQFTTQAKWPDDSIKWVLLDFNASVKTNTQARYTLCNYVPDNLEKSWKTFVTPKNTVQVKDLQDSIEVDAGRLNFSISKYRGTILDKLTVDGITLIGDDQKCESVMVLSGGYPAGTAHCVPHAVKIESAGPLRACIMVQGKFLNAQKKPIKRGVMGYTLRVTAYADKPYLKIAFTLCNNAPFTAKKRSRWLRMESWGIRFPVLAPESKEEKWTMACADGQYDLEKDKPVIMNQWLYYPDFNDIGWKNARSKEDDERIALAGITEQGEGFFYFVRQNGEVKAKGEKAKGWIGLSLNNKPVVSVMVRRFWQNFPRGFHAAPGELTVAILPKGGFWPRTKAMAEKELYVMDGARQKTVEMLLWCGDVSPGCDHELKRLDSPLFARAPLSWYKETGTVWPIVDTRIQATAPDVNEAIALYNRLQLAKVHKEKGDLPGPLRVRKDVWVDDEWGKVSIPSLREMFPEVLYGWMNFGDLAWSWGYCSLHYDWPYGMLMQHLRFNDPAMFYLGDEMARHRYDIDKGYYGFQHYEKGYHGDRDSINRKKYRAGFNAQPTHTWNRGLLLHWALTGDPNSLAQAQAAGKAFARILGKVKDRKPSHEFRVYAWAIDGCLAMYEYTGETKYLDQAYEGFVNSLLRMEKANGSKGHIIKDGKQSAQFVSYMIEPIARLHHLTQKAEVVRFLKRVLDWHCEHGTVGGVMRGQKYAPLMFGNIWREAEGRETFVTVIYNFQFADGYAYLYKIYHRKKDLQFSRKIFRDGMFYYGCQAIEKDPAYRTPLGYHFRGRLRNMCSKVHAFSTRYDQIYLQMEQSLAEK